MRVQMTLVPPQSADITVKFIEFCSNCPIIAHGRRIYCWCQLVRRWGNIIAGFECTLLKYIDH